MKGLKGFASEYKISQGRRHFSRGLRLFADRQQCADSSPNFGTAGAQPYGFVA
jgi:hypothetical protein